MKLLFILSSIILFSAIGLQESFAEEFSKEFYISNGFEFINYSDKRGTYSIHYKILGGEIIEFIPNIWTNGNRHDEMIQKI